MLRRLGLGWILLLLVGCGDDASTGGGGSGASTSTSAGHAPGGGGPNGGEGTGASSTGGSNVGGSGSGTIPGGGTVLFEEHFDDANFGARGWYDGQAGAISTEAAPGSASSFECAFAVGASSCTAGKPARHPVQATESVYLSFWIKFDAGWVGSGVAYHPHMMHFINDADDEYVGPSHTFLTTYTEVVNGRAVLALQDSKNVDLNCLLKNDDTFQGCNGDFASYPFTESRSACSCNGLAGFLDGRDCFPNGDGTWYSSRSWDADAAFIDDAGAHYKGDWHFVEVYFEMNSIQGGVGVPDGKIRWVQDDEVLISSDEILMRTNDHPTLAFNQFAILPYIGVGSPIAQSFYLDDLTVATARPD